MNNEFLMDVEAESLIWACDSMMNCSVDSYQIESDDLMLSTCDSLGNCQVESKVSAKVTRRKSITKSKTGYKALAKAYLNSFSRTITDMEKTRRLFAQRLAKFRWKVHQLKKTEQIKKRLILIINAE